MTSEAALETREAVQTASHREAFLRLIERYGSALNRLASAYVQHPADREDLLQEIAIALWQAIPRFRGASTERTWMYRIAHNVAISSSAKLRRAGRFEQHNAEPFDRDSSSSNAEQEFLTEERRRLLIDSIRDLPVLDRQIIQLHLEGLPYAEIEEITGVSEGAVATRLTRIREKLKAKIQCKEVGGL